MKHRLDFERYRVRPGKTVRLARWPTEVEPLYRSKDEYPELLAAQRDQTSDLQELLYASNSWSLLLIFQAMDTAGKDGVIRHVMSGIDPQGCQVTAFKVPSATELDHDFLWRTTLALPERGRIGIFNRSYYEEVIVVRVHPELLYREGLPDELIGRRDVWRWRYRSINDHERHLSRNGIRVVKFYLHLSRTEQRKRLLARIDDVEKHWKFNTGDVEERKFWGRYMRAYEACLSETSTDEAPWYIVPADDKPNARLIVSRIILSALQGLNLEYPSLDESRRRELRKVRKQLVG